MVTRTLVFQVQGNWRVQVSVGGGKLQEYRCPDAEHAFALVALFTRQDDAPEIRPAA